MSEIPEPMTLSQSLHRIYRLMRAYWGSFLGVAVGPAAAFYVLIGLGAVVHLAAMSLYAAFTYAVMKTALAVIYHDQRWRKDGALSSALSA